MEGAEFYDGQGHGKDSGHKVMDSATCRTLGPVTESMNSMRGSNNNRDDNMLADSKQNTGGAASPTTNHNGSSTPHHSLSQQVVM